MLTTNDYQMLPVNTSIPHYLEMKNFEFSNEYLHNKIEIKISKRCEHYNTQVVADPGKTYVSVSTNPPLHEETRKYAIFHDEKSTPNQTSDYQTSDYR